MNAVQHNNFEIRRLFNELNMLRRIMPNRQWTIRMAVLGYFDQDNEFHEYNLEMHLSRRDYVNIERGERSR